MTPVFYVAPALLVALAAGCDTREQARPEPRRDTPTGGGTETIPARESMDEAAREAREAGEKVRKEADDLGSKADRELEKAQEDLNFAKRIDRRIERVDNDLSDLRLELGKADADAKNDAEDMLGDLEARRVELQDDIDAIERSDDAELDRLKVKIDDSLDDLERDIAKAAASVKAAARRT